MYCGVYTDKENFVCEECDTEALKLAENKFAGKYVEELRKKYKKGAKVRLNEMKDIQSPPKGSLGIVELVDDIGSIHCRWPNGSGLALIPGIDSFELVPAEVKEGEGGLFKVPQTPVMVYTVIETCDGDTNFSVRGVYLKSEDAFKMLKECVQNSPIKRWEELYKGVTVDQWDGYISAECPNEGYFYRAEIKEYPLLGSEKEVIK